MGNRVTESDQHPDPDQIFSVSQLNRSARLLLEEHFALIWVAGEISNFTIPASGHWYFSLKDQQAQVRCAMFRNRNQRAPFMPKDGMAVLAHAQVSLYEGRGDYQLIVSEMEEMGLGALRRAFEQLKNKLFQEGLFAPDHKKSLPLYPHCIGVITSPTGAAIRDILSVLGRRFPLIPVIIYPAQVQGSEAKYSLIKALDAAVKHQQCDVLLMARGGGSLEDLWPFNEESVARAIFQCPIPIMTGIGHEIDTTIADYVADKRASTPSAAAELLVPDGQQLLQQIALLMQRLSSAGGALVQQRHRNLEQLLKRLRHPRQQLRFSMQRVDDLSLRLNAAMTIYLKTHHHRLSRGLNQLQAHSPLIALQQHRLKCSQWIWRLRSALDQRISQLSNHCRHLSRTLAAVSPQATLQRGYTLTWDHTTGKLLRSVQTLSPADQLRVQFADGEVVTTITKVK